MPHPDCPTKRDIIKQADVFSGHRRDKAQKGHDKHPKYHVLCVSPGNHLIQLWWSDKLHPHSAEPDFRPDAPMATLYAPDAPNSSLWLHLRHNKQLATLIAAAIERTELVPWPS